MTRTSVWTTVENRGTTNTRPTRRDTPSSPIHKPYNNNTKIYLLRREARVKFRCERDTLADAVATAQRAVASRTGAMPVLSGLRLTLTAGSLELVGTDLELTIRVRVPAETDGEGSAVVPARLFSEIVHKLEAGTVSVELADDDAQDRGGPFRHHAADVVGGASSRGLPEVGRGRGAGRGGRVRGGAAPGGAGRVA